MSHDFIWNFPLSGRTTMYSSDNNSIDTFADDRLCNLTREIIQNSLDAINDCNKEVVVEFKTFKTKTSAFPGLTSFKKYLEDWINQTELDEDNKDYLFVKKALTELNKDEMQWLRISDYNTTGLWGSSTDSHKCPYFSFIHGAGLNSKQDDNSGGSKGTGKNAIFANSILQTMFVSSYTKDNELVFIGVGFLVSKEEHGEIDDWTHGVGYCVTEENARKNSPINEIINIDPSFNRIKNGYGTDIYIPAFILDESWAREVMGHAIMNFMPAFINRKLEVRIVDNDTVEIINIINKGSLAKYIGLKTSYRNNVQKTAALNIYNALTSDNKKTFKYNVPNFEMTLYMLEDEFSGDNRMYIFRCPTNMFIQHQEVNAFCKCTGVLLIQGNELAKRLRAVEDATHTRWSPSKAEKTKYSRDQIEDALQRIINFKEKYANNFGNTGLDNESDFDYLIENDWCSSDDNHEISKETLKDVGLPLAKPQFSIRNDPSKHSKNKKHYKRKSNKIVDKSDTYSFVELEGEPFGTEEILTMEGINNGSGADVHPGNNIGQGDISDDGARLYIKKNVEAAFTRMIAKNPNEGEYTLSFTTKSSGDDGEIEINALGSSINDVLEIKILEAHLGMKKLKIKRNKIQFGKIERLKNYKINIKLDTKTNYIWEVNINANA